MVTLFGHEHIAAPLGEKAALPRTGSLENFLTPEAMLTPGVAGAVTMTIANTLYVSLGAPPAWTALVLSFTFGVLVLAENRTTRVRVVLYVLNSLVIFCVAWGMNSVGADGKAGTARIALPGLTQPAFAQGAASSDDVRNAEACAKASAAVGEAHAKGKSAAEIERMLMPCRELSDSIANPPMTSRGLRSAPTANQAENQGSKAFFAPWRF